MTVVKNPHLINAHLQFSCCAFFPRRFPWIVVLCGPCSSWPCWQPLLLPLLILITIPVIINQYYRLSLCLRSAAVDRGRWSHLMVVVLPFTPLTTLNIWTIPVIGIECFLHCLCCSFCTHYIHCSGRDPPPPFSLMFLPFFSPHRRGGEFSEDGGRRRLCTDCKALWGKFVICDLFSGYIQYFKLIQQWNRFNT